MDFNSSQRRSGELESSGSSNRTLVPGRSAATSLRMEACSLGFREWQSTTQSYRSRRIKRAAAVAPRALWQVTPQCRRSSLRVSTSGP